MVDAGEDRAAGAEDDRHDDRHDDELVVVHEAGLGELANQGAAAEDDQLGAGLLLAARELGDRVAGDEPRVGQLAQAGLRCFTLFRRPAPAA